MRARPKAPPEIIRDGKTYRKLEWFVEQTGVNINGLRGRVSEYRGTPFQLDIITEIDSKNLPVHYLNVSELYRVGSHGAHPPRYLKDENNYYEWIGYFAEECGVPIKVIRDNLRRPLKHKLAGIKIRIRNLNFWYVLLNNEKPEEARDLHEVLRQGVVKGLRRNKTRLNYLRKAGKKLFSGKVDSDKR